MNDIAANYQARAVEQVTSITVGDALRLTSSALKQSGIGAFAQEARLLVCHFFKLGSVELISNASMKVNAHQMKILDGLIERRKLGEPIGRIIGEKEFYGLRFCLSADTLEPRADTECLVDAILDDLRERKNQPITILDIGTGTGAIIISLLCNLPNSSGVASDISENCLKTTRKNAQLNGVDDRLLLVNTNWSEGIDRQFDVIVSNPPYISSEIISTLSVEVRDHDPIVALDGGSDGLVAYRNIFTQCSQKIGNFGKLYLEIGYDQGESVSALAANYGWRSIRLAKDLAANDRVIVFERNDCGKDQSD